MMQTDALVKARIPVSTYRLQFNGNFRFADAGNIVKYLNTLGISDIYASPYLGAKKGSQHGYDIINHSVLNPEVGSREEFDALSESLTKYGMGQLVDIVPNHMGIGSENSWWMDLLENGPSSHYAGFFDIDWQPVKIELKDKLLLPVLGAQYGTVLENQDLKLFFEEGAFFIAYYGQKYPIRPQTYSLVLMHRLGELGKILGEGNPYLTELLSIKTSLEHLPPYTEKDRDRIRERLREKEVAKRRLQSLCEESPEISDHIGRNIADFNGVKGEPRSFDLLDDLINAQVYRLSYWRVAAEEINYRRFFDVNELAAIRVEDPEVFLETHRLIFSLIQEGKVTGLRVDHPDGLYDPASYFKWLQKNCFLRSYPGIAELEGKDGSLPAHIEEKIMKQYDEMLLSDPQYKPFYVVGEKILLKGERLPEEWTIFSTTGYVFLNSLNGIFIDYDKAKIFDDIYSKFIRAKVSYADITYEKKKLIMQAAMSSEINTLGHYLNSISEKDRHTRDFTLNSLTKAIIEVIAFFPVYRTYTDQSGANDSDRKYIELAATKAKKKNPAISGSVFDFLKDVLLLNYPSHFNDAEKKDWRDFVMRFQQITGPVMAKGVEDTAFYVYNRLVSLNEVGGSPDRFGTLLGAFHGQNIERIKYWPNAMITTATHDTKRGEDMRARINVLSEIPNEWRKHLASWSKFNRKYKIIAEGQRLPERNDEYLLYQTLIGAWPLRILDSSDYESFRRRIMDYMLKAVREAKVNSSWISPDVTYEDALLMFIKRVMEPYPDSPFMKDFLHFQNKISHFGIFNSVSQTLLKMTAPGVPDFYQGTELWDFRLVDPDNRSPVDYDRRIAMIEELKRREADTGLLEVAKDLLMNKDDGRIKMYLICRTLNFRKANRDLFEKGDYMPIEAFGERADNVCAFARILFDEAIIVAVPRMLAGIEPDTDFIPIGKKTWGGSFIAAPGAGSVVKYRNIFTGEDVEVKKQKEDRVLYLSDVFADFPAALLEAVRVS